jgi:hypothetical protein
MVLAMLYTVQIPEFWTLFFVRNPKNRKTTNVSETESAFVLRLGGGGCWVPLKEITGVAKPLMSFLVFRTPEDRQSAKRQ